MTVADEHGAANLLISCSFKQAHLIQINEIADMGGRE